MTDMIDDWRSFLARWSREWADAQVSDLTEDGASARRDDEPPNTRRLAFPPASEEKILALEQRLGLRLPPSYRTFLAVSDGWRHAGGFVWLLAGTDQVRWHEDEAGLSEFFPGELDEDSTPEEEVLAGMWERSLQLDVESDAVHVLLDPGDVGDSGEWAVYSYASWRASPPERYASFGAFMEAMYREFHLLQVDRSERAGRRFVNATTRAQDAAVEAARLDALGGRYEQASAALAEAVAYGRPRATGLRDQIRRLLGETCMVYFHGLTGDPLYAPEVLAVLEAEHRRHHRGDGSSTHLLRGVPDAVREAVDETLARVREGTFRYTAEGPFGRAVDEAREQARWGETDTAWRTLCAALPKWRPLGSDHIAPVGLLADPLLGPLITPDRGRELLATPRAGLPGDAPGPAAHLDPPGLAWLAEDSGSFPDAYRFLLVEGVEPTGLPARIGADEDTGLNEPMEYWEARTRFPGDRSSSAREEGALAAVGRAGPGWSFAFEPRPGTKFDERRFISLGIAASAGTRAVTVWSEPSDGRRPGVFHLSVAENGEERYGFTVRGATIARQGHLPGALDPDGLYSRDAPHGERLEPHGEWLEPYGERLGERRALEALAAEFGCRLPRFAIRHGSLHTFRTRPWSRPPGLEDLYATFHILRE
ncbi:SMI1/KNR4 family protein [Streptomyces sp. NPDC058284]|uniref:SMI1/KNR4 family protein n=1 Tax=unclassified Streptomyces TaxID=2593676 RepID=UPI003650C27D